MGKPIPARVAERAARAFVIDEGSGCHLSTYSVASHGYAQIGWTGGGKNHGTLCHRAVWTHYFGQIADGMTVDHTCKNRRCVNVSHLRLLPNYENARRTSGRDWPLGECINGHPNSHLIRESNGRIRCERCRAIYHQRHRDKKRRASH